MPSARTLYYLQQMGIQCWENRRSFKLLILNSGEALSEAAQTLLMNMLQSIALSPEDIQIIQNISTFRPTGARAVLILGDADKVDLSLPAVRSYHPHWLLQHPKEKKQAYRDFLDLKKILA